MAFWVRMVEAKIADTGLGEIMKYLVVVEFINDVQLIDSVTFYASEAAYAASLARTLDASKKIFSRSHKANYREVLVECLITKVIYAPI